jgi:hypothetical protein
MMAERRAPGYTGIKKRWLPRKIGPEFYSITLTVFIGIFGFLVTSVVSFNLRALIFFWQSPYYFITTYVKDQIPSLNPKSLLVVAPLVVMNISGTSVHSSLLSGLG